jgi:hypothetical protein
MKKIYLVLIVISCLYSCTDSTSDTIQNCGTLTNVAYESFSYCGVLKEEPKQASFFVLNSNEDVLKKFATCQPIDVVLPDFTQKSFLGLFAGPKPTGGYEIKIQAVVEDNCQIIVEYFEKEPLKNEIVTTAVTYPSDYILLPKSKKPIIFKKVKEIQEYVIIGSYSLSCLGICYSVSYRIDDSKTIRFLLQNPIKGSYKALKVKEDLAGFISNVPPEVVALKGQTKEFRNDLVADGGGCYFEYHQGDVVTKIRFVNFNIPEKGQENLIKFESFINRKINYLETVK